LFENKQPDTSVISVTRIEEFAEPAEIEEPRRKTKAEVEIEQL
jgi:hypothetical protein